MLAVPSPRSPRIEQRCKSDKAGRNLNHERRLWYESNGTESLGCTTCRERAICGGLRVQEPLFDCLHFCCGNARNCDRVCPNHPDFVDRVREVSSFSLSNVRRAPVLTAPELPHFAPMIYPRTGLAAEPKAAAVALSLYSQFDRRSARPRFLSKSSLSNALLVPSNAVILASGVDRDGPLERWWQLGERARLEIIRAMLSSGIGMVTTPNYSLFTDRPRHDNLYAMKRIATVHEEFLRVGMPAALHVNGRTDTDFRRWAEYIADRPEVTHIAYEFTTGTSWSGRRGQHAAWLIGLNRRVGRPLHLMLRGGIAQIPVLARAFSGVTLVDTSVFMKTMKRQRAYRKVDNTIGWESYPTRQGAPLDDLFATNLRLVEARITQLVIETTNRIRLAG